MNRVEVSTRFATTVSTLPEAFTFVMEFMEKPEAGQTPSIHIHPLNQANYDTFGEPEWETFFEVIVDGVIERERNPEQVPQGVTDE